MKKSIFVFLMLTALLTGCARSNESKSVSIVIPEQTTEAAYPTSVINEDDLLYQPDSGMNMRDSQKTSDGIIYTPILTNGESSPGASFSIDDVQLAPIRSDVEAQDLYATRYFSFDDLQHNNIMSDWVEYEVQHEEDVCVKVTSCSWYPHTSNIEVGIVNLRGSESVCSILTSGNYCDELIFENINAGTYIIYVRNLSSRTITEGSLRYSLKLLESSKAKTGLSVFEHIFMPVAGSSEKVGWDEFETLLKQENLDFSDDEGIITVLENSFDGSYLYAVLTNENSIVEIAQLGYHYEAADGEYGAMVDWSSSNPRYLTDVTMPDSGMEVTSLAAVKSYIMDATLQSSPNGTYGDVEAIIKEFADAYFAGDSDVIKKHLSRIRNIEFTVYEGGDPDKVVINAIKGLDNISADIKERGYCIASVEFKQTAESDYYIYLTIEIILEGNQWKIAYYTLEM